MGKRITARLLVVALAAAGTTPAPGAEARPGGASWVAPVEGRVVRPFDPPAHPGDAGHRGVDFAAAPGTPVRAAAAGTVVFAGDVAGVRHVTVAHRGGVRTGYSFLASLAVRPGQRVAPGAVVGHSGGSGRNHSAGTVHFAVRVAGDYVDPAVALGITGAVRVRLAPTGRPRLPEPYECPPAATGGRRQTGG